MPRALVDTTVLFAAAYRRDGESTLPTVRAVLVRRRLSRRLYADQRAWYLYAFDDDFDAATDVYRLDTATNPYTPP